MRYLSVFITVFVLFGCTQKKELQMILTNDFVFNYNDKEISLYTLKNENGLICQLTNFGARVVSLWTPDKNGELGDVVVGYGTGEDFVKKKENYFGATIGRYGNRIGNAAFSIDGVEYKVEQNDGENHLHGGGNGFHRQVWDVELLSESEIVFSYISPDMESVYPGTVAVKVKYQLTEANELKIEYFATTDKTTVLNLTNHTYFNLKDAGESSINNHKLTIKADYFTPVDAGLIPTGELGAVKGTAFDFRNPTSIGKRVDSKHPQIVKGMGYDHNWVLNNNSDETILAARVEEPESGRVMEVYTNEPGIQFYGGNFLDGTVEGKFGIKYGHRSAFCLETQHYPNSPNQKTFPEVRLEQGEEYHSVCIYRFK